jgi:integrase
MHAHNQRAIRWLPWICALTGARAGEVAQLRASDLKIDKGVYYFYITPEAGRVKTGNFRQVPLHPQLLEQGLVDVFEKRAGMYVFADIPETKEIGARAAGVYGKVAEWIRSEVGITDPEVQPNHAWRHRFATVAREADIAPEYSDVLKGHEDGRAAASYGETPVSVLYRELCKIPKIELSDDLTT